MGSAAINAKEREKEERKVRRLKKGKRAIGGGRRISKRVKKKVHGVERERTMAEKGRLR